MEKLKACPFCGDVPKVVDYISTGAYIPGKGVMCENKECVLYFKWLEKDKWNRRQAEKE